MSWIARLDSRAAQFPRPVRWAYHGVKWYLVAAGVIGIVALAATEISERRVGLGTGTLAAVALGTIKGILTAPRPTE